VSHFHHKTTAARGVEFEVHARVRISRRLVRRKRGDRLAIWRAHARRLSRFVGTATDAWAFRQHRREGACRRRAEKRHVVLKPAGHERMRLCLQEDA
jgi:hypothetical protein